MSQKRTRSKLEYQNKIKILKNKIKKDMKNTKIKLSFCVFGSNFISFFVMLINLLIIALSLWALIDISIKIANGDNSIKTADIVIPIIVSIFTIFLFIVSILLIIYSIKNKYDFYKNAVDDYQYLILKIQNNEYSKEEIMKIINQINTNEEIEKKLNFKKLIKKALGG